MISFIWDRTPTYIKWPVSIGFILFLVPLKIRDEAVGMIQREVHAVVNPMNEKRDLELLHLKGDVAEIKQDTAYIKKYLMERR